MFINIYCDFDHESHHVAKLQLIPFFLYSVDAPRNCPSNGVFNSESPITELVMMASSRCCDSYNRRYYIETLRDHTNNCEFDIMKPEPLRLIICLV